MKVAFRTDASIQIGTGHVMRCLTLANELTRQGHECWFVCREHPGNLGNLIASQGHGLTLLPASESHSPQKGTTLSDDYALWLGVPWQEDARQTLDVISLLKPEWLVIDHYALDAHWEEYLTAAVGNILVIDDLANRSHRCELLLDQTYGRSRDDYTALLPSNTMVLCGAKYALLRSEFGEWRGYSLARRNSYSLKNILITMGGADKDNFTGKVLEALKLSELPRDCKLTVVMGETAPWVDAVKNVAQSLDWETDVLIGVTNMAELMADSDLAIGAAGSTSWERCCLGLPSITVVLAENQKYIAKQLSKSGACVAIDRNDLPTAIEKVLGTEKLRDLSLRSSVICDGKGVHRVVNFLSEIKSEDYCSSR